MAKAAKRETKPDTSKSRGRARASELALTGHTPNPIMTQNHTPLTPERVDRFMEKVAECGNLALASRMADGFHSARSYKRLIDSNPEVKQRYLDALDAYSATVAQVLNEEVIQGNWAPAISAGSVVKGKDGKEIWLRKRDPKLLAMLARKHDRALAEIKRIVTLDGGKVVDSDQDPAASIFSSDLWSLSQSDAAELLRILKLVHENRNASMALANPRVIDGDFEDVETNVVTHGKAKKTWSLHVYHWGLDHEPRQVSQ